MDRIEGIEGASKEAFEVLEEVVIAVARIAVAEEDFEEVVEEHLQMTPNPKYSGMLNQLRASC